MSEEAPKEIFNEGYLPPNIKNGELILQEHKKITEELIRNPNVIRNEKFFNPVEIKAHYLNPQDKDPAGLSGKEREDLFWAPENLDLFFKLENGKIKIADEAATKVLKDSSLDTLAKDEKIRAIWALAGGEFLEKLWSSVDILLRQHYLHMGKEFPSEAAEALRDFYAGIRNAGGRIQDKMKVAMELRQYAQSIGSFKGSFAPEDIHARAIKNEAYALEELKKIKAAEPPFWVERKKGFTTELDIQKFPPFAARGILEEWRMKERKREKK